MSLDSFRRATAAAGLATITAAAGAQTIAPEVTVPLGDGYGATYGTTYGTPYASPKTLEGGVVYDRHGGAHPAYVNAYGFTPPSRNPVERIPVQYLRYYPAVWYGLPGSTLPVVAPQVHMPTDTTQLGFYYQRVPTWAPVPGMIPGPPDPAYYNHYAYGIGGGMAAGTFVSSDGTTISSNDPNVQIISSRPLGSSHTGETHSSTGTTPTDPGSLPIPPAPSGNNGSSSLPLQPPPAPAAD